MDALWISSGVFEVLEGFDERLGPVYPLCRRPRGQDLLEGGEESGIAGYTRIDLLVSADITSQLFACAWEVGSGEAADDVALGAPHSVVQLPSEDNASSRAD